jgi:spore coat polysaccharide biosynthesis predicted glycosyltransferase SpsG
MELIPNKLTKQIISENKKFEYIFKVILGSFNKKKKKPIGIFTDKTIQIFKWLCSIHF